jgi:nucleoside-diphosphate-sugar epimerase
MTRFLAAQLGTSHWFHIDRAQRELGFSPRVDLDTGLDRLLASLRAAGSPGQRSYPA